MILNNIRDIVAETNSQYRWQAGNYGCAAVMFGFTRPEDHDESGMWRSPMGQFHDTQMPAIIERALTLAASRIEDEFIAEIELSKLKELLLRHKPRIEAAMQSEEHKMRVAMSVVLGSINSLIDLLDAMLFEEQSHDE